MCAARQVWLPGRAFEKRRTGFNCDASLASARAKLHTGTCGEPRVRARLHLLGLKYYFRKYLRPQINRKSRHQGAPCGQVSGRTQALSSPLRERSVFVQPGAMCICGDTGCAESFKALFQAVQLKLIIFFYHDWKTCPCVDIISPWVWLFPYVICSYNWTLNSSSR